MTISTVDLELSKMETVKADSRNLHSCEQCSRSYKHRKTLNRHVRVEHGSPEVLTCAGCSKTFKLKYTLKAHAKICSVKAKSVVINCAICNHSVPALKLMTKHYEEEHEIKLEQEVIRFNSEKEFYAWKTRIEEEECCSFVIDRTKYTSKDGVTKMSFRCHRDGIARTRGKNIRHRKSMGSNKIGGHCPAKLKVSVAPKNVVAVFCKTHIGHQMELGRIRLSKEQREKLARQIAMKIPFDVILRDSLSDSNLKKVHLTRKDLYNIEQSFGLNKERKLLRQSMPKKQPKAKASMNKSKKMSAKKELKNELEVKNELPKTFPPTPAQTIPPNVLFIQEPSQPEEDHSFPEAYEPVIPTEEEQFLTQQIPVPVQAPVAVPVPALVAVPVQVPVQVPRNTEAENEMLVNRKKDALREKFNALLDNIRTNEELILLSQSIESATVIIDAQKKGRSFEQEMVPNRTIYVQQKDRIITPIIQTTIQTNLQPNLQPNLQNNLQTNLHSNTIQTYNHTVMNPGCGLTGSFSLDGR